MTQGDFLKNPDVSLPFKLIILQSPKLLTMKNNFLYEKSDPIL